MVVADKGLDREREREALLSQVQRYPQLLTPEQWAELRTLAKDGDLDAQLLILRSAVGPMPDSYRGTYDGTRVDGRRDALVLELVDRLAAAERRAGAAEAQVQRLREQNERLRETP